MNFTVFFDVLQQADGADYAVDGHGDIGLEAIVFDEPVSDARMKAFEFGDDLTDARTSDLDFRLAAG